MKAYGIFISFVCLTLISTEDTESSSDCHQTWPSNLTSPRDCCIIPLSSAVSAIDECDQLHLHKPPNNNSKPISSSEKLEQATQCFLNATKLMVDGSFNKTSFGKLYSSEKWKNIISEGIEKCEFDIKIPVHDGLAKFFDCVNAFMGENCLDFKNTLECEKTGEFFDKCHPKTVECTEWIDPMFHPKDCCKTLELISEELQKNCTRMCQMKEFFFSRKDKCVTDCLYGDERWKNNDKLMDYDKVKEVLEANAKGNEKWKKVVEAQLKPCKEIVELFQKKQPYVEDPNPDPSIRLQPNDVKILEHCLRRGLSRDCADYNLVTWQCYRIKKFAEKCPTTKPYEKELVITNLSRRRYLDKL